MTDNVNSGDNQTVSESTETPESTPQFGSGVKNTEPEPSTEKKPSLTDDDIELILRRNSHAQDHIKTLESETATLRDQLKVLQAEVERSKNMDEFLDALREQDSNSTGSTAPQLDEKTLLAKLKEEVFQDLSAVQQAELQEENWRTSTKLLKDKFGEKYASYVDARAKELDMTNEEIEALARTKPKAFMELVTGTTGTGTPSPTQSSQRAPASDPNADIEVRYSRVARLRKLRTEEGREAAKLWSDPDFQAQYRLHILEKAKREGSQFGNQL